MRPVLALHYRDETKDIIIEEILKAEGLPYTRLESLDNLEGVRALILGETPVSSSQLDGLEAFVEGGGVLITVRPENYLSEAFGIHDTGRVQKDGYIILKGGNPYVNVSYKGRLQIFGFSKLFVGGEKVVDLSPSEEHGGIIRGRFGGGNIFIVAYDISTTFLTIQQRDSLVGRAYDTSVVEAELSSLPQLDLMRRLFVNLAVESINVPLPRKWYFPGCHKSLLLLSGDQDGADHKIMSTVKGILKECGVPYTLFITPRSQPLSSEELREISEAGVEIALHPDFVDYPFTEEEFRAQLEKAEEDSGVKMTGSRNHCLRWGRIVDVPLWMERCGVQYDSNLGLKVPRDEPGAELPRIGYFVGGGLPYFFIHPESFRRIDVLEEPLLVSDDTFWLSSDRTIAVSDPSRGVVTFRGGMGLSQEEAFQLAKRFMDDSLERYYTVQCYDLHPVYLWSGMSTSFFRRIVEYAKRRRILIMGQGEWNSYWRGREEAQYVEVTWNPAAKTLEFTMRGRRKVKDMTLMIPHSYEGARAKVYINGAFTSYREENINGKKYAFFTVDIGPEDVQIKVVFK